MTGIPIEVLFGAIAALIGVIYWDLRTAVYRITQGGAKRDLYLAKICEKLGIDFKPD